MKMTGPGARTVRTRNSRPQRQREAYLEQRARIYYQATHPALVGPRHPCAPPVRHPRTLTVIIRGALPESRGLGTPARPALGTQGVLRSPSGGQNIDEEERKKMRAAAFLRVSLLISRRALVANR
ncbi:hypothetical protein PGTUg99_028860 [Puccinia graminis f. sp. tritici]|uniref:Uncharacterized protein n=1 Tax=Puccinia graminis f. sp. tritici TaxID=56615 RepID=A0A5B0S5B6_PUCGR|nr:hypothetical protein PGTUg99_028860 [Puccinia graminis f. sp. tritici]